MIDPKLLKFGDRVRNIKGGFVETFTSGQGDTFHVLNSLGRDVTRYCRDYDIERTGHVATAQVDRET